MDDDLVRAIGCATADEANATARELLLHGIGATAEGPISSDGSDEHQPYGVLVVRGDRLRAREILGIVDERELELEEVDRARRTAPSLKILIPVLIGAFFLIPAAAFYLSYKVSGG